MLPIFLFCYNSINTLNGVCIVDERHLPPPCSPLRSTYRVVISEIGNSLKPIGVGMLIAMEQNPPVNSLYCVVTGLYILWSYGSRNRMGQAQSMACLKDELSLLHRPTMAQ